MNIIEAAKFLKIGRKIRRKSWCDENNPVQMSKHGFTQFGADDQALRAIQVSELLADDWEVVEEKQDRPPINYLRGAINSMLCSDEFKGATIKGKCDQIEAIIKIKDELMAEKSPMDLAWDVFSKCLIEYEEYQQTFARNIWIDCWMAAEKHFKSQQ